MNLAQIPCHAAAAALLLAACATRPASVSPEELAARTRGQGIEVSANGEPLAFLRASLGGPVTLAELMAHGERPVLRGFPLAPRAGESFDHPEHRGMWVGHGSVNDVDFWNGAGTIELASDALGVGRDGSLQLEMQLLWKGPDRTLACDELRTLRFRGTTARRTIDSTHVLRATGNGLAFGDVQDGFFALRLADAFQLGRPGARRLVGTPDGTAPAEETPERDPWGQPARWIASIAELPGPNGPDGPAGAGGPVTVAVFDHPANHGHPARWHVRPYGIVAVNPFGVDAFLNAGTESLGSFAPEASRGALRLGPYDSIELRYRVVIAPTALDRATLEAEWTSFAETKD